MTTAFSGWTDEPSAQYHADTEFLSHSMLETFRQSPRKYHAKYVAKTLEKKEESHYVIGSAFHTLLLEPAKFWEEYAVTPERWDQRTKAGKESLQLFKFQHEGKTVLWPEEAAEVNGMVEAARLDPLVCKLLDADGLVEKSFRTTDPETGLKAKCRPDKVIPLIDTGDGYGLIPTVLDVKTTADHSPDGFTRSVLRYGYHRQRAFYLRVLARFSPEPVPFRWLFLAFGKSEPYEVSVYALDEKFSALGVRENHIDLTEFTDRSAFANWRPYQHGAQVTLSAPKWATPGDDEE